MRVRTLYLIPSDKQEYATAMLLKQAQLLQAWYQWQMGNSKTFTLNNPIVEVLHSTHPALWYNTNPAGADETLWYWYNTLNDVTSLLGPRQPDEIRVTYVDSIPDFDQHFGGNIGKAVMSGADIAGIMGQDPERRQCHVVGGSGHEYGHTFGLLHHPEDQGDIALMYEGFRNFSDAATCILRQQDKDVLNASAFFTVLPTKNIPGGLCPFNNRLPPPRP